MERQVFLKTERLDLVVLNKEDAPVVASWFNNPEVTKFLSRGDVPMTIEAETEYLEKVYDKRNHFQLGIWHRSDKKLIGTVGWHSIKDIDQSAVFGIVIGETDYWGDGVGTEALKEMLNWAFNVRGLRNVTLSVLSSNPRGQKCYEKCGFTEVGRFPKHVFKNGQWHDEILMHQSSPLYD